MKFTETPIGGAFVIDLDRVEDERGFFARSWCEEEFRANGLNPRIVQCNVSYNRHKGTLRGMHFLDQPYQETKLVRCTMGEIHDVIIDLRPGSAAFLRTFGVELSAANRRMLYVPEGCAHGFVTVTDEAEVFYQMGQRHVPGAGNGVRWNDPAFGIEWPIEPIVVSMRDASWPLWGANA